MSLKEIMLDGVKYVLEESSSKPARINTEGLEYKLVRCDRSGVFAGYLKSLNGQTGTILQARRIFYWSGAASLSQLAIDGTSKPKECKFPEEVSQIIVTDVIEILNVTEKAKKSIDGVAVWKV
jgi:hypothetical protein